MEDFIGNNAKFIVEWGQLIIAAIIIVSIFILYLLGKNNKYFLPVGYLGYFVGIVLIFLIAIGTLAFKKVTNMKPRISMVINKLESLQNNPAPPFDFYLLTNGTKKNISDYLGKVVLLNYWATWCAPCIKEMPELNRLQMKYRDQDFVVIALSDENRETLLKFEDKIPFIASAAYSKEFNWADIQSERPMTFLINKKGIIVDYFTGGYDYDFFESKIIEHLTNNRL